MAIAFPFRVPTICNCWTPEVRPPRPSTSIWDPVSRSTCESRALGRRFTASAGNQHGQAGLQVIGLREKCLKLINVRPRLAKWLSICYFSHSLSDQLSCMNHLLDRSADLHKLGFRRGRLLIKVNLCSWHPTKFLDGFASPPNDVAGAVVGGKTMRTNSGLPSGNKDICSSKSSIPNITASWSAWISIMR